MGRFTPLTAVTGMNIDARTALEQGLVDEASE
jgi:enoyl-CoA hydratase/carnithine racemase